MLFLIEGVVEVVTCGGAGDKQIQTTRRPCD